MQVLQLQVFLVQVRCTLFASLLVVIALRPVFIEFAGKLLAAVQDLGPRLLLLQCF